METLNNTIICCECGAGENIVEIEAGGQVVPVCPACFRAHNPAKATRDASGHFIATTGAGKTNKVRSFLADMIVERGISSFTTIDEFMSYYDEFTAKIVGYNAAMGKVTEQETVVKDRLSQIVAGATLEMLLAGISNGEEVAGIKRLWNAVQDRDWLFILGRACSSSRRNVIGKARERAFKESSFNDVATHIKRSFRSEGVLTDEEIALNNMEIETSELGVDSLLYSDIEIPDISADTEEYDGIGDATPASYEYIELMTDALRVISENPELMDGVSVSLEEAVRWVALTAQTCFGGNCDALAKGKGAIKRNPYMINSLLKELGSSSIDELAQDADSVAWMMRHNYEKTRAGAYAHERRMDPEKEAEMERLLEKGQLFADETGNYVLRDSARRKKENDRRDNILEMLNECVTMLSEEPTGEALFA